MIRDTVPPQFNPIGGLWMLSCGAVVTPRAATRVVPAAQRLAGDQPR